LPVLRKGETGRGIPGSAIGLKKERVSISELGGTQMIRKLKSGEYRLYSRKKSPATGKKRNLGTFSTMEQAKQHEKEVQYFKRH
jgi:hypothetical protein